MKWKDLKDTILTKDNFIFFASILLSALICIATVGVQFMTLGLISVMFTYVIYTAKPNNGEYAYVFVWLIIILIGCYVGIFLHLSIGFYIFLLLISTYYYISYGRDDVFSDRAIAYLVIYASLGTTIPTLNIKAALAFLIGGAVCLCILRIVHKQKPTFSLFKSGIFSRALYTKSSHVLISALIYSALLFLCLYLPDHFGLRRAYWAPMTFVILLKPKEKDTIKNTIDRFWGSAGGALFVFAFINTLGHYRIATLLMIAVIAFVMPICLKMTGKRKTFALTIFVLLLLETAEFWNNPNYALPYARIYETFIGGLLAVLGSFSLKLLRKHHWIPSDK